MSEQGEKPEVLPGDLITRPGLYEARCGDIVVINGIDNGWWTSELDGILDWYCSDGRRRLHEGPDADRWQLLHWVGPLPGSEPETTTEQLAEIDRDMADIDRQVAELVEEAQQADYPQPEPAPQPVQVREGRWRTRHGDIRNVTPTPAYDSRAKRWPWRDAKYDQTWREDGGQHIIGESPSDLVEYLGPIEPKPQPQPQPQAETEAQPETQPQPIQVREGRWRTRNGDIRNVTPTPEGDGREHSFPWWDAQYRQTWTSDGRYYTRSESPLDLVEYLGPLEQQPQPKPQPPMLQGADERIRLLKQANDAQAETIERLQGEARDLNMEIGGLERQLLQRDARIRDLETMHAAAAQAVVDAGKQNDALRLQVQNRQQEYERQKGRIEFLETLDAGNAVAIVDYRAKVEKLQGLLDFARKQLEDAANEISQQRSHLDAHDKQLDEKDAQIRDLRIELDAAQQVPQPVGDEERERIWDEATEAAGRQVVRWLRPLTLALNRQPDERFSRFMALTLSVLPDLLPELLGYAVEDESLDTDEDCE